MNSYLIIRVTGKNITRLLQKCRLNSINILNVSIISYKEAVIKINKKDYDRLISVKSIYKVEIISSSGLSKFIELIKKNKIFLTSSIIGILFLVYLSNTIFSIQVISDNNKLNEKIIKELNAYGIKKYSLKKSYKQIEKIKNHLKEKYEDNIEWIEITDIGTKYQIKIVERKKNKEETDDEYTNIVAKKSGVIRKIYAESGQKIVELNTYVNKGDIIISGSIMKDDTVKQYVHAKGKVYAEIWYNVKIEFPLEYTEKKYTSNESKRFYIKLNDKYIGFNKFKNFERKKIISLENRLIPFEIGIEKQREIKIINDKYTTQEAKTKAIEKAKEKVLQSLDSDEYIIDEKVLNFKENGSKIELDMFFVCYEEIAKEEKLIPEIIDEKIEQ